ARFAKLEQSDKEKTDLIAKLEWDVSQIKQASVTSQSLISPSIKNHSDQDDSTDSVNLEQTQSAISPEVNSNNISEQTDDTSENAPNSDVCQSIHTEPKSSEDKEKDDFLDRIEKERVSNMIRERNREKLQKKYSLESNTHQNSDLSLDNQNASSTELEKPMPLPLLCNANTVTNDHDREEIIPSPLLSDAKTVTNGHDQNNVYVNSVNISEVFESDDQIVENLIQEMSHDHTQSVISSKNDSTSLDISRPGEISKSCIQNIIPGSAQSLSYLFDKAYAIEHGINPKEFSIITEAERNRWAMGCFPADLERDIRFYRGGIKRKEDPRKYRKFLTDRERLVGEELLRRSILKSGLSTAWLDDLMKEWEEIHTQF
ncbi:25644_t:CDS:2, partial [Gigaspora margarita]